MAELRLINEAVNNSMSEALIPIINEQRKIFFDNRIAEVKDEFFLDSSEIQEIWNLFLAGEHPEYANGRVLELLPEIKNCPDEPINSDVSWCFHNFKWVWSLIWKDYQLKNALELSARAILRKEKSSKQLADHPNAKDTLKIELDKAMPFALKKLNVPSRLAEIDALVSSQDNEPFKLDIEAIDALKTLDKLYKGEFAKEMINFLELVYQNTTQSERANSWKKPLFFHLIVARVVWRDCVKKKLDKLVNNPPAISMSVYSGIITPMHRMKYYDQNTKKFLDQENRELVTLSESFLQKITVVDEKVLTTLLPKGAGLMNGLTANKLTIWEIKTVNQQFRNGFARPEKIIIDGGYRGLMEILNLKSKKAAEELRAIIAVQSGAEFKWPCGAKGNILLYKSIEAAPGRRAVLELTLADIFCPFYTFRLDQLNPTRNGKRLLPIPDTCGLIDPRRYHGAQVRFQQEIVVTMKDRSKELLMYGGVIFKDDDFPKLAMSSLMPASLVPKVIDRMLHDGDDAPAFLTKIEKDTFALAPSYSDIQRFLVNGAKKEINGRNRNSPTKKK